MSKTSKPTIKLTHGRWVVMTVSFKDASEADTASKALDDAASKARLNPALYRTLTDLSSMCFAARNLIMGEEEAK